MPCRGLDESGGDLDVARPPGVAMVGRWLLRGRIGERESVAAFELAEAPSISAVIGMRSLGRGTERAHNRGSGSGVVDVEKTSSSSQFVHELVRFARSIHGPGWLPIGRASSIVRKSA